MQMKGTLCYVAFLDILGFKDLIMGDDTEHIDGLLQNLPVYIQRSLAKGKTTSTDERAHFDVADATINSIIISDTLIFWTIDNSAEHFFDLLDCVQSLMHFTFNTPALFLRGAVTFGEFYHLPTGYIRTSEGAVISHPMVYGKGLVTAHEIEKCLDIAGCLIDQSGIQAAKDQNQELFDFKWMNIKDQLKIFNFDAPTKKGPFKNQWFINWVSNASNPTREKLQESFGLYKRKTTDDGVQLKINNTLNFYDHAKSLFAELGAK
jgi:hypothetical protein